ncbi:hypothetical protein AKJ16_DCAP01576 [Drosera capensis]
MNKPQAGLPASIEVSVTFLGADACLLAGSARNPYHTRYRGIFGGQKISCATYSPQGCICRYRCYDIVVNDRFYPVLLVTLKGWDKHRNEGGFGMTSSAFTHQDQQQQEQYLHHLLVILLNAVVGLVVEQKQKLHLKEFLLIFCHLGV